jgi:hypothetical protein
MPKAPHQKDEPPWLHSARGIAVALVLYSCISLVRGTWFWGN